MLKRFRFSAKDIFAGVVVALVSIPIAMGYAQIAGLPPVYGLYGSVLPILVYSLITTSPQFVVGVDAMPAAMVGALLSQLSLAPATAEAIGFVPVVSLLVAMWFVAFFFLGAGRIVKYISVPVMSGFISGVGVSIILMQIPKLFGGNPGMGEAYVLIKNIGEQLTHFNSLSFLLGFGTIAIILILKKYCSRVPAMVVMIGVGALLQLLFAVDTYGVKLLPQVTGGMPEIVKLNILPLRENAALIFMESASIAAVIMAQTLLATGSYASKYGDEIKNSRELLAYAGMNIAAFAVGCCPVNGSVSRSNVADSYGCRSQTMSIAAAFSMLAVLFFGTPLLSLLPVPVLTGIVMTALLGIVDIKMFKRLWKSSRNEWCIFMLSFLAVLVLGTVNGVIVGCILSFGEVAVRAVAPPAVFIGRIPGHGNFHSLKRNSHARPIRNTVIYRFGGNLFFANIDKFENDIKNELKPDTRQVVIDARGIGSIDITAIDRLIALKRDFDRRGIKLYFTEHDSQLNDQLRKQGGMELIESGCVRRTITLALRDAGLNKPYLLEGVGEMEYNYLESEEKLAELEWAFGDEAVNKLSELAEAEAEKMALAAMNHSEHIPVLENHGATTSWGMLGLFDEQEFWDFLEARLESFLENGRLSEQDVKWLETQIEERRKRGVRRLAELNPNAVEEFLLHRADILLSLKDNNPDEYGRILQARRHTKI